MQNLPGWNFLWTKFLPPAGGVHILFYNAIWCGILDSTTRNLWRSIFAPYEKYHSTVKDACELAEKLGVQNLLLYHTEDRNLPRRKGLYTNEGKQYYTGRLFIPDDLEMIAL